MKIRILFTLLFISVFANAQTVMSPILLDAIDKAKSQDEILELNIYFHNKQSLTELAKILDDNKALFDERVKAVTSLLKDNSEHSKKAFLDFVKNSEIENFTINKSLFIVNMLNVSVSLDQVYKIASFNEVRFIDLNTPRYKMIGGDIVPIKSEKIVNGIEPGLKAVKADVLWAMGYTGRNILFLSIDTGVFPEHPAISDRFAGNYLPMEQCWYGIRSELPTDRAASSHGTHTTGTVLGLDPATNDTIGVAYNSYWIASDPVATSESEYLDPAYFMTLFEWTLDPDGNPETTDDVPRVINNSWGYDHDYIADFAHCEMVEAEILVVLETAGICSPFSAGNEGPGAATIGFPASRVFNEVNPMSVGAITHGGDIASFSSRGPAPCMENEEESALKIKPEVVAPGVAIRSSIESDSYGELQGTSMACPHVSGVLLLLSEAFPMASAYELKKSLYQTAIDLGEDGEDNAYGRGLIDAEAAFNFLAQTYTPVSPIENDFNLKVLIQDTYSNIICPNESVVQTEILVQNTGIEAIQGFNLKLFLNNQIIKDTVINETIDGESEYILNSMPWELQEGRNTLYVSVKSIANIEEYDRFDNGDVLVIYVIKEKEFPYQANFNNDELDAEMIIMNLDNITTWETSTWGNEDQNKALSLNFANYGSRDAEEDYVFLPLINLQQSDDLYFNFTYAYKKRLEYLYADSLIVELSTDCGINFDYELWRNGGEDMATVDGNAGLGYYKPVSNDEFDTISLSLSEFSGQDIVIRLRSVNDMGSILYIDNLNIDSNVFQNIKQINTKSNFEIYPNPASEFITIISDEKCDFEIYNSVGQLMKVIYSAGGSTKVSVSKMPKGVYFVKQKNTGTTKRLVIM